jgi:L,D-transpeptidase catalytic domain
MRSWRLATFLVVAFAVAAPSTVHAWGPPDSGPSTTAAPPRLELEDDSVPNAGWFHVGGFTLPTGTVMVRYSNVDRAIQTGLADHGPGPLSFWFRAPGPPGSAITIRMEALNGMGGVIGNLGTIRLTTGNEMLPLPVNSGSGRRMVVHSDAQQVWLVEDDGRVSDTFLMSGRRIRTASGFDQTGLFRVYSKSRSMRYCEGRCGRANYMVRYQRTTRSAVGSHSLPLERGKVVQGVEDLGWPLSHGCSRLEESKALAVYRWASVGTIVVVF